MPKTTPPALYAEHLPRIGRQAGIGPDDVLAPLLVALGEAVDEVKRGPDPAAEQRIAESIATRAKASLSKMAGTLRTKTTIAGAAALVVALGGAFGAGWWLRSVQPVQTALGPLSPSVVRLLQDNDMAAALDGCVPLPQPQGQACSVAVWLDRPLPPRPQR